MMLKLDKILVPVDYSENAKVALEHALELAALFDGKVDVFYAWAAPYYTADVTQVEVSGTRKTLFDLIRDDAKKEMEKFTDQFRDHRDRIGTTKIVSGEPAECILKEAKDGKYGLLVLGTHGRTGISHFLMGSVAEVVARLSPCPVLTVPAPHDETGK